MTHQQHLPDQEFVARLENHLRQEYRRRERLGTLDRPRLDLTRWFRAAGFTLAGLFLGAACAATAQHFQETERIELLLRHAEAGAAIASRRVELNRRIAEFAEERVDAGLERASDVYPSQAELVDAELRLALAELDVEEVRVGRNSVRDEIFAPRVGGRDFVSERFRLELDASSRRLALLDPIVEIAEARANVGIPMTDELSALMTERERLSAAIARLRETLALRQAFLGGGMDAEEAELRHRLVRATTEQRIAESRLNDLRAMNELVRRRVEVGVAPTADLIAFERALLNAEAEAQLAETEIELIRAELDP